ncbi:MAG TPA: site-2 protease family protein [Candidatus Dormibacteraeota bacterium]|nr:site-2 protease family protein [Candidatus Dormibacteraeota bacterium]
MNDSIHLGRIAGIRIGANWSLLVVFALITWSLATAQLPLEVPHQPASAYWTVAVIASLFFFGSLLAHELGHALLARSMGIEIEGITLWLFGGVARFRADAGGAGAELRIAAVGPGVSLGLAVVFLLLAAAMAAAGVPALVVAAASWLGVVNVLLGGFNLLPAFPLDGGRVLRALLWRRSGRLPAATATATRVGAILAYLMIGLGIVSFFIGDVVNGVWLAFLGWFLLMAGRAEAEGTVAQDALAGVRVADVMTPDPATVPAWITVDDLVERYLLARRHSGYPIVDLDGRPQGLVTVDLLRRVPPDRRATTRLAEIAYPLSAVVTARPDEPFAELARRLGSGPGARALVFDGDRLVGVVSPTDVARVLTVAELRS